MSDGVDAPDVGGTHAEAAQLALAPLIVVEGLEAYLPGEGPVEIERLGDGHSNETFRVCRGGGCWVLRRPPRPPYSPTAHDVVREHAVLAALIEQNVRAPRPAYLCEDPSVIGAPFYLMELVDGFVIRDSFPPALDVPVQRRLALEDFVDALVELHSVDWRGTALERLGKPEGYLERQLVRWRGQWEHNRTRAVPDIDAVAAWLHDHLPERYETSLVHGDYKLDNALYAPTRPARVLALLDWEMATLGAPLADLGLLVATYLEAGDPRDDVLDFSPATALEGALTRKEIVARYAERSGRAVSALPWYIGFALWKLAILLEGSYRRHIEGTTRDSFFARLETGVPRLAAKARAAAEGAG